jgi:hypothetical protein
MLMRVYRQALVFVGPSSARLSVDVVLLPFGFKSEPADAPGAGQLTVLDTLLD